MKGRIILKAIVGIAASLGFMAQSVFGAFVNFDDGTQLDPIDNFYSAQGVIFQNTQWQNALLFDDIDVQIGASLPFVIQAINTNSGFSSIIDEASAIVATFSTPISEVQILAGDVGRFHARINAYDALVGGNLIGFDELLGSGSGTGNFGTLTVVAEDIRRIELFQPAVPLGATDGDGLWFDDLSFQPVPLPAAVWLLASSLLGLWGITRKRTNLK